MNEVSNKFNIWTFSSEIDIPNDVDGYLIKNEEALLAFKTIRDIAIFTNKRIIIRDAQGIMGKKIETYTIPYSSINMYSTENAGFIDINTELELWTKAGHLKINLKKGIDISKIDKIIANYIL
ncbi:MAG: PH domain-containing protein [Bacilli bacterium]